MVMRGAAAPKTWVCPLGYHLRIHSHLIIEPEQRNGGELFVEMVTDRPGEALPFTRVNALGQGIVVLLDELVFKSMPVRVTGVGVAYPFFRWPPGHDIRHDAAMHGLASAHVPDLHRVEGLDRRINAHLLEIHPQRLSHHRAL